MRISTVVVLLALVTLLGACGPVPVHASSPQPNIDAEPISDQLALQIDDSILNDFTVSGDDGGISTKVDGWRSTIEAGYQSSLAKASGAGPNTLTVRILRADLVLSSAAVTAKGSTVAVRAQVTYQARLVDSSGKTIRKSSGTAISKKAITKRDEATANASEAVESMWELIAEDFFSTPLSASTQDSGGLNDGADGAAEKETASETSSGAAGEQIPGN